MKRICVVGCGYVGLVTGACLAELGHHVTCLDVDREKISLLKKGQVPFYEPGLEERIGKLAFTTSYQEALQNVEVCFLTLPTPSRADGSCDDHYVFQAASELAKYIRDYIVIVNKSTVPVGTTKKVHMILQKELEKQKVEIPFDVVSNPEFLQEGSAIENFMHPDRILLGVESARAQEILLQLYAPFKDCIQVMDIASSEFAKYGANLMLALRISAINHLSNFCEKIGGDIEKVVQAIGADPRIGNLYLQPGIGFGGSCLPKDVKGLCAMAKEQGYPPDFFQMILKSNQKQREIFFHKILNHFDNLEGITLAIWGLSFKPNTDDMREAPSLDLIKKCLEHGALLRLYDPMAMKNGQKILPDHPHIVFCKDLYDAADGADGIVLVTEWEEFRFVDFCKLGLLLRNKVLFDGRNFYENKKMQDLEFDYYCIGKKSTICIKN